MGSARAVFWKNYKAKFSFNYDVSFYGYSPNAVFAAENHKKIEKLKLI